MKKIAILILLIYLFAESIFSQTWNGVCAGINDYPGSLNDLNWCVSDAYEMQQKLITYKNWSSNQINLLTDSYASESGILTAIANMPRSSGNINLFHFSGHGDSQELGGDDGLIPANSLFARITPSELQSNFGSNFNYYTTFLDACGSGIFPDDMSKGVISSACKADEYSFEDPLIGHGVFTYYLLQGLQQSNIITAEDLHNYAAPRTTAMKPSQHPQISDNYIGNLFLRKTLSGTISFENSLTIPTGVTITISPYSSISFTGSASFTINNGSNLTVNHNSTLTLSSGSLIVYGTLTATNTIFDFTTPYGLNGIKMYTGAIFNSSGNIVRNAWYGVYKNCTSSLSNLEAYNCQFGVYCYSNVANNNTIANLNLHNNNVGLGLYNFPYDNIITGCNIYSNSQGIFSSFSTAEIGGNDIYSNSLYGINVYNSSFPCLGKDYPPVWCGQQNNIYSNGTYNIYNQVSGVLYALHNWWGSNPPPSNKFYSSNGTIVYTPYLTSPADLPLEKNEVIASVKYEGETPLFLLLNKVNLLIGNDSLEAARKICLQIISDYPDSSITYNFLGLLPYTFERYTENRGELTRLLQTIMNRNPKKNLYGAAGLLLSYFDQPNRLSLLNEIISNFRGERIIELALYNKFLYYFNEEQDLIKAEEVLSELDGLFPGCEGSIDAHRTIGEVVEGENRTLQKVNTSSSLEVPDQLTISNYPNPFNPSTTIRYNIPEDGKITLKVIDILGREIKTLVNEYKTKGRYEVTFDAGDLSSGIYFYTITSGSFTVFQKMILMK